MVQFLIKFHYEYLAPDCFKGDFECGDGECIDRAKQCDGQADCSNWQDELFCGMITLYINTYMDTTMKIHLSRKKVNHTVSNTYNL